MESTIRNNRTELIEKIDKYSKNSKLDHTVEDFNRKSSTMDRHGFRHWHDDFNRRNSGLNHFGHVTPSHRLNENPSKIEIQSKTELIHTKYNDEEQEDDDYSEKSGDDDGDFDDNESEGGWGWVMVTGAFLVYWLVPGLIRSYGAIHLEILETFPGCTDAQASWIPAILNSITVGLAPISAVLGKMYSCRNVVFVGGLFCFAGLTLSYFANSVFHLYLTFGLITGIGAGLSTTPSIIAVNSHFVNKRALASGICLSGSAAGSFTIPVLVKFLVDTYNFRGAMLIMGASVAHICACALLFTPDGRWTTWKRDNKDSEPAKNDIRKDQIIQPKPTQITKQLQRHHNIQHPITVSGHGVTSRHRSGSLQSNTSLYHSINDVSTASVYDDTDTDSISTVHSVVGIKPAQPSSCTRIPKAIFKFLGTCLNFRLFRNATYTMSVVCAVCIAGAYPHVLIYVPAYATTLGITKGDAGMLLSICSVVDLFGRIGYGYFTDLQIVKRQNALAFSCAVSAISALCIPLATSYVPLAFCTALFGFGTGTGFMLLPVILADNHGVNLLPSTYGLMRLFQGFIMLIMPPIAGAMKDATGHYEPCFYVMGTIATGGVIAMVFLPFAQRRDSKKELVNDYKSQNDPT